MNALKTTRKFIFRTTANTKGLRDTIKIYRDTFANNLKISHARVKRYLRTGVYSPILMYASHRDITSKYIPKRCMKSALLGFALIIKIGEYDHIDYIAINPKFHGQGLIKHLMEKIPVKSTLECQDHLVGLYVKYGYQVVGQHQFGQCILNFMLRTQKDPISTPNKVSIDELLELAEVREQLKLIQDGTDTIADYLEWLYELCMAYMIETLLTSSQVNLIDEHCYKRDGWS